MSRLTKPEIRKYRTEFEQWQPPGEMLDRCRELNDRMGSKDFFSQPGIDFIRDGWAAAMFGQDRGAESVRLVPEDARWPDFEMQLSGQRVAWELTEADLPKRRRGDEYRDIEKRLAAGGSKSREDPVENWVARADQVPEAIRSRCEAKAARHYSERAALLIYLNISEYGIRQKEIEDCFQTATASAKNSFSEIWVLWKKRAYAVWKDGHPAVGA